MQELPALGRELVSELLPISRTTLRLVVVGVDQFLHVCMVMNDPLQYFWVPIDHHISWRCHFPCDGLFNVIDNMFSIGGITDLDVTKGIEY